MLFTRYVVIFEEKQRPMRLNTEPTNKMLDVIDFHSGKFSIFQKPSEPHEKRTLNTRKIARENRRVQSLLTRHRNTTTLYALWAYKIRGRCAEERRCGREITRILPGTAILSVRRVV